MKVLLTAFVAMGLCLGGTLAVQGADTCSNDLEGMQKYLDDMTGAKIQTKNCRSVTFVPPSATTEQIGTTCSNDYFNPIPYGQWEIGDWGDTLCCSNSPDVCDERGDKSKAINMMKRQRINHQTVDE
jgi:hypothetical protein